MSRQISHAAKYKVLDSAGPNAPWIAMAHGLSQDHRVFDRQVDAFVSNYRIILIDLPGHGMSTDIKSAYGLSEYSQYALESLQDANVDKCHFWGTHTGAGVGLLLACSDPSLILSLVLESPVIPGRALPSVANLFTNVSKVARTKGIAEAREFWWQEGAWFDVMRARTADCRATEHRQIIESFNGYPWLDAEAVPPLITPIDDSLRKIESPVLIINGEFDLPDFIAAADALEQCIPRCHRFNVEEAGGFPLWEFPERVNEYVSGFLRNFVIAEKSH